MQIEIDWRRCLNYGFSLCRFLRNWKWLYSFVDIRCTKFYLNRKKNIENTDKVLLTPVSKVWKKHSELLSGIMCSSPVPCFTKISEGIRKVAYVWKLVYALEYSVSVIEATSRRIAFEQQRFVNNSYTVLHEHPTDGLVSDTRSHTDGRIGLVSTLDPSLLFREERPITLFRSLEFSSLPINCMFCRR